MTHFDPIALGHATSSDFAAQGQSESDFNISTKCVMFMSDGLFFLQTSVFAAQGQSESEICISMRNVFWFDEHV